jgi:hypothetical protein
VSGQAPAPLPKPVVEALEQVRWLIDNSKGVVGLRLDGGTMPWTEVVRLYLPSWRAGGGIAGRTG